MVKNIFHIKTLSAQGCGIAEQGGKKYIIPFTLPGEEVEAEPVATKKNAVFCRLVRVIQSSPKRAEPQCRYFGHCGGCNLQHMPYVDQLEFKQNKISELFTLHSSPFTLHKILSSPKPFNYRNRITLHTDGKSTGYYKSFSHEIVEIETCALLADDGIRTLRPSSGGTDDEKQFFTQVNSLQNGNLIKTVLSYCADKKWSSCLELYCGAGNLSFDLAKICKKLIACDSDADAIQQAQKKQNVIARSASERAVAIQIPRIKFIYSSSHDMVFNLVQDLQQFDLIVLDPPREGLKETVRLLPRLKPKQIVYVSCNPQTFLKDVKALESSGYLLTDITPIDMFPQTYHVEVVGKLLFIDPSPTPLV
jgi:23S rRNA (uracil1939-C5)-methyltransferase